jgi:hypothetical protein
MRFKDCGNGRGRGTTPARHTTDEHGHARETEAVMAKLGDGRSSRILKALRFRAGGGGHR